MPAPPTPTRPGAAPRAAAALALGAVTALTLASCSGDSGADFATAPPGEPSAAAPSTAPGDASPDATSPTAESSPQESAEPGPAEPADRSVERSLTFIALGDEGARGPEIGCGDSAVTVPYTTTTITPLAEVMEAQIAVTDREYEGTGLYNVLSMSELTLDSATIHDRHATVELSGEFLIGGVCDIPRVYAQLEGTALQFDNVDTVTVLIDGQTLQDRLSLK